MGQENNREAQISPNPCPYIKSNRQNHKPNSNIHVKTDFPVYSIYPTPLFTASVSVLFAGKIRGELETMLIEGQFVHMLVK